MKKIFLMALSLMANVLVANTNEPPVLNQVDNLIKKNKYAEAKSILENQKKSSNSFYTEWLYARVLGEMGDVENMNKAFDRAAKLYDKNVHTDTKYDYVIIDQVEYLTENGKNAQALVKLDELISYKPSKETLEYIYPLYESLCVSDKGFTLTRDQMYTLEYLKGEVKSGNLSPKRPLRKGWLANPYLTVGMSALTDEQPLKGISADVSVVLPKSELVNLTFDVSGKKFHHRHLSDVVVGQFNVKNKFSFSDLGMSLTTGIGVSDPSNNSAVLLAQADLEKRFKGDLLVANVGYDRQHFTGTLSSVFKENVAQDDAYLKLLHKYRNIYTVGFLAQRSFYKSNDKLAIGAWGLVNIPTVDFIDLKVGYGFSYADADKSKFVPTDATAYLTVPVGTELTGVYDPYYTPDNQRIHMAIGSLGLMFSDRASLVTTFKYALHATNGAPLLYVAENELGERYVQESTFRAKYTPWNLGAAFNYKISNRVGLNAFYEHDKTYYYTQDRFGMNVTYEF